MSTNDILYACVSYKGVVLVEHKMVNGNFIDLAKKLVAKIPPNSKKIYSSENHNFHYISENDLAFLCLCHEKFGVQIPAEFLMDVKVRFISTFGQSFAHNLNGNYEPFARTLEERMRHYSNPKSNKMNLVMDQVSEARGVITDAIEKTIHRGEKIEIIVDKTERLQAESFQFKSNSVQLKRKLWWQNKKLAIVIAIVVIILIAVITLSVLKYFKVI
ncbi:vesicle-associated membrane protein 7 [Dictyostelium purpureum]|uniref:Vesicle-associated membrane protein 7 n=1 Tax=Dictyostelium purpureum TaxID=5786 RepID=F0ZLC2_DICPU|nr:vesicle-associated membrane protein 7 [Dictyostelium purpureum]EGC35290.1 vesicle-associated membrane protein 7 [Dictyostelium purpureum]|eukprot:XP_003288216.1 vesicle-associated membrane protein 7 [Dictyostelium purpureum]